MPSTAKPASPVIAVECSQDIKTGPVSVTYAPIQSCPGSCPLKGNGAFGSPCYGMNGNCGIHFKRISALAEGLKPAQIAKHEARAMDRLSGYFDLRLHVVGDARTIPAVRRLAAAADRYLGRYPRAHRSVWGYTQAWRKVPRAEWGKVSIIASCYTRRDVLKAMDRGYAAALIIEDAEALKAAQRECSDFKIQRCLYEAKGIKCYQCRWCLNDKSLKKRKQVIAFLPHGSGARGVRDVISDMGGFWG